MNPQPSEPAVSASVKPLKAYKVACGDDDHGQKVVFAQRSKEVDRRSNCEHCDCEFLDRTIHRAPEFDKYSPEEKAKFDALNQRCHDRARGHPDGPRLCIICAYEKPYGVFDSVTGACVCVECRDKARR